MSCLKCLGSEPESRQLQVRQGWGGPGGRAKEGSALPSNNTGAVALEPALGFPAGTRRTQKRGQKRGQELLGGNQGCQGDGPPLRGRGGFCGQPQFPNPGLQARVVWGKEQGERGGPQPPPLGLSPRQYIGLFVSMRSPGTRKTMEGWLERLTVAQGAEQGAAGAQCAGGTGQHPKGREQDRKCTPPGTGRGIQGRGSGHCPLPTPFAAPQVPQEPMGKRHPGPATLPRESGLRNHRPRCPPRPGHPALGWEDPHAHPAPFQAWTHFFCQPMSPTRVLRARGSREEG